MGQERRREGEQGEMRAEGKLRSHSSFQKSAPIGPAGPQVSARAPQTTMAMCYVCVMSALIPNIYPSNAVC